MFSRPSVLIRVLCLILVASVGNMSAAEPPKPRPKVALVLAGGGALGMAHVGVIKWMEEHRIPVDYVTGTSMGGLVGGYYATGVNAGELENFVLQIDWQKALLSEPPYDELSFRRKEDRRDYEVGIPLGLAHGLNGPNGFSSGHGVELVLDQMAYGYSDLKSFDDLPIPFRCVATDMLKGTAAVLHDGSLVQAMRATMAIPGVFTPVERDGTVLADGGIVNNMPADVARDLGADVVIAVRLVVPLEPKEALNSLGGVLAQTVSIVTLENEIRRVRFADVVVDPEFRGYSITDYGQTAAFIARGYKAADVHAKELLRYQLSEDEWQAHLAARYARKRQPQKNVGDIQVTGISPLEEKRMARRLEPWLDRELNQRGLATQLTRIVGEGRFDSLGYELYPLGGEQGLRIRAHEKPYGPPFVDLALNVNGSGIGQFEFAAGFRITAQDVGHHGGEWRSDVLVGSSNFLATEFYQPIGNTRFFVAPNAFFSKRARDAFAQDKRVGQYRDRRTGGGLDLGFATGRRTELRLGYQFFNTDFNVLLGEPVLPQLNGNSGQLRLAATYDGQDSPAVPSRGLRITGELLHVIHTPGGNGSFRQFQIQGSQFFALTGRTSLFLNGAMGTSFSDAPGPLYAFSLGGPFRLGAYNRDEFLGKHYGLATFGYRREVYRLPSPLGRGVFLGGWYDVGSAFNDPGSFTVRSSFNAGVIAETIFGPIGLTANVSPTGRTKVNFSVGRFF